jgi:hypothetical protein
MPVPPYRVICLVAADVFGGKGKQCQVPGTLDGNSQPALMFGARTSFAPVPDFASIGQIAAQSG